MALAPLLVATLVFVWVVYLWELYLTYRQYKVYKSTKVVPTELQKYIDTETFEKSRSYQIDKTRFGFFAGFYSQLENTLILYFYGIPFLWGISGQVVEHFGYNESHEITQSLVFMIIGTVFSSITSLPWSLYSTFVIEERHGFNKQTIGFYFKDYIKKFILSMAISLPVTAAIIYIIKWGGDYFFIYAWGFVLIVSLFMILIYHDYIAPLFDRFILLPEGPLRDRIQKLAERLQFPLGKINVVEGSKRSSHSNAYFFGFWGKKVIVIFDTLLKVSPFEEEKKKEEEEKKEKEENNEGQEEGSTEKEDDSEVKETEKKVEDKGCTDAEIEAILSHELGHWKLNHMLKNLAISQVNLLLSFFVFGLLMHNHVLYESFGFYGEMPTFIGLIIIFQYIFSPYNELVGFLMTVLSRSFEFEADDFGKGLGYSKDLQSALIKLHKENLGFPVADWLYSAYHYSHPPLLERLRALQNKKYD